MTENEFLRLCPFDASSPCLQALPPPPPPLLGERLLLLPDGEQLDDVGLAREHYRIKLRQEGKIGKKKDRKRREGREREKKIGISYHIVAKMLV